jgi:hypothetical protein
MLHIIIINTSLAYTINQFENIKSKVFKCKANIYTFNKLCNLKGLIPTYAKISVPNTSPASLHRGKKVHTIVAETDNDFAHSYH